MDARALSRLFALGLTLSAVPLLGCDRVSDADDDGGADGGEPLTVEAVAEAYCQHQWDCYNQMYDPEVTVDVCVSDFDESFDDYEASETEACVQGQLDYYACLSALECGAFADYYEGEDEPGAELPCLTEGEALEQVCESEGTDSDPGGP